MVRGSSVINAGVVCDHQHVRTTARSVIMYRKHGQIGLSVTLAVRRLQVNWKAVISAAENGDW